MISRSRILVTGARLPSSESGAETAVLIDNGRILAVGASARGAADAHVIDANGATVTTGLMNAATHLGLVEISSWLDGPFAPPGSPPGPPSDAAFGLDPNATSIALARADGLTRALVFPSRADGALIAGAAAVVRLVEGADILDLPQAAVFATIGDVGANAPPPSRGDAWLRLRRLLLAARDGEALARLALSDTVRLEAEALVGVLEGRCPLVVQAGRESDVRQAAALARGLKIRVAIFGGAEAWRAADALAEAGVSVILNPFDNLPANIDSMGARLENAAILRAAGVRIAFSTPGIHMSHNAGSALREAAGLAVANGLPWIEAIRALTASPAAIFGLGARYGDIAPGQDADLVLWDGDLLEPASSPMGVLVRGQPVSLTTRQSLLARRHHPTRRDDPWPPAFR